MTPTVKDIANLPADKLPPLVHVPPVTKPFDVTIRPPGSKSLTNRALLLAALAEGESALTGALADADDAQVMVRALRQLGAEIEVTPEFEPNGESCGNATIKVKGVGGRWKIKPGEVVTLNLNNAGTATRFLTAAAVLQPPESGGIVIDGNARMRERPISELVDALRLLGLKIEYLGADGFPPLKVYPSELTTDNVVVGGSLSSQFISALMLTASWLPQGLCVMCRDEPASKSYIRMTGGLLSHLGATVRESVRIESLRGKVVPIADIAPGSLGAFRYAVEPDATGAAPLLCAAILGSDWKCTVPGLNTISNGDLRHVAIQHDAWFCDVLRQWGAFATSWWDCIWSRGTGELKGASCDLSQMPDCAMAAAVVSAFANGATTIRGLKTLRVKETDRIAALRTELAKVGVGVEEFEYADRSGHPDEGVRITPPPGGIDCSPSAPRVEFDTYDDHRMAMSLALIGLRRPNVYIRDPGCVRKTYPTFWRDLAKLYG